MHVTVSLVTSAGAAAIFLSHLDSSRRTEVAAIPELAGILEGHLEAARATWPAVQLSDDAYLEHLAEKLCERATEPAARVLETISAADLFLAAACARGDDAAIVAFRDAHLPGLRQALGKLGAPTATIDEAIQRILVMLFVGDTGRPQIAGFSGRGRLRSWLRSLGVRTTRRLMGILHGAGSGGGGSGDDDDLDRLAAAVHDP